jgi:hypothetical protein
LLVIQQPHPDRRSVLLMGIGQGDPCILTC